MGVSKRYVVYDRIITGKQVILHVCTPWNVLMQSMVMEVCSILYMLSKHSHYSILNTKVKLSITLYLV